jgi:Tfp pilus assembly protein PilF
MTMQAMTMQAMTMQAMGRGLAWTCVVLLAGCATVDPADVRSARSHRDLAAMYLSQARPEIAIREYRIALELYDRDAESHFGIGEAYRRKREFAQAEHHFRRALQLDPTLLDARLNLGVVYLEQERWADAIRETELLTRDPTFLIPSRAFVNLGWAHYRSGDLDAAEHSYRKALEADGSSDQAHTNLAIVLYEKGDLVPAVRHFGLVLDNLKGRPIELFGGFEAEIRFRLAMAHVRLGQRQRAIEQLRLAAERGGETEWAQKSLEYLAVLE